MSATTLPATHNLPTAARHPQRRDPQINGFGPEPAAGAWPHRPRLVAAREDVGSDSPLPDPANWSGALARAAVEIILGGRPVVQLVRWLDPTAYERLSARAGLHRRVRGPAKGRRTLVRAVRLSKLDERHVEAAVAVWDGARVRAVAMRLEARRARWLVIDLTIL